MSTPSTTIITNLKSAAAPTGNTVKSANTAGIDFAGMLGLAQSKALELKACLTLLAAHADAADGNLATLNNILASLVSNVRPFGFQQKSPLLAKAARSGHPFLGTFILTEEI